MQGSNLGFVCNTQCNLQRRACVITRLNGVGCREEQPRCERSDTVEPGIIHGGSNDEGLIDLDTRNCCMCSSYLSLVPRPHLLTHEEKLSSRISCMG